MAVGIGFSTKKKHQLILLIDGLQGTMLLQYYAYWMSGLRTFSSDHSSKMEHASLKDDGVHGNSNGTQYQAIRKQLFSYKVWLCATK
jgi:hypothetical protein